MRPMFPSMQPFHTGFSEPPVGAVVAFAGSVADTSFSVEAFGWLVCDGRMLAAASYPELFAVLGYLYGGVDGQFQLPDYRGRFLRGHAGGSGACTDIGRVDDPGQPDARPNSVDVNYLIKYTYGPRMQPSFPA